MTDSEITTEVQKSLGRLLTERNPQGYRSPRRVLHGVEVPVTYSGIY